MSLRDYGINETVVPSGGGWHYRQPFGEGTQRIPPSGDAGTAPALINMVRLFRAQQHIPINDVEHDVAEYVRKVSPQNDRPGGRREPDPMKVENQRGIFARCRDWLILLQPQRPKLLTLDEADERAQVCLSCPQNIRWQAKCEPCNEDLKLRMIHLRQLPHYQHDEIAKGEGLKACRLHGFLLGAAVFVDREKLPDADAKAPAECWMRTTA